MKQLHWNIDIIKTKDSDIDLNLLVVFQMLMSEMNATKAAVRLGVSQAAVSAALRRLRTLYGDPLFERTQRGFRPTPRAVFLQPSIEEALQIISGTLNAANYQTDHQVRTVVVRIGLSDDFEMAFGARILGLAKQSVPHVRIVLRQTNSLVAAQALNDREIDLAITSGGFSDGRLKHVALGSSDYLVVYDPLGRGSEAPIEVEEYVARDHILVSYSGLTGITDDVLAEHGLRRTGQGSDDPFFGSAFPDARNRRYSDNSSSCGTGLVRSRLVCVVGLSNCVPALCLRDKLALRCHPQRAGYAGEGTRNRCIQDCVVNAGAEILIFACAA
ncbi:LysR family transcriptional regulator [Rhizobium rhizosphaerae]|uniref:LysR family transcriptional regulator n=1 Tax=Xaviernesmea rhizosphaerae TaxID=1672749 RepID=UPI0018E9215C|nr:LysR family transcriptional regulator [Xaviernesmea rhizosphaerae]